MSPGPVARVHVPRSGFQGAKRLPWPRSGSPRAKGELFPPLMRGGRFRVRATGNSRHRAHARTRRVSTIVRSAHSHKGVLSATTGHSQSSRKFLVSGR